MSNQNPVAERIGHAWHHHREGRNDVAIAEFEAILKQNPNDIDANYGLGLAQKADGRNEVARQSFQNTLQLVEQEKGVYQTTRNDHTSENSIKTPEDDRFMMLSRMIEQRLAELDQI